MPFPVLGSNSAVAGGYEIDNSLRFNDGDNPLLTRTHSDTNHRTFTFSCWVKRSALGTGNQRLFSTDDEASDDHRIRFTSADILHVSDNQSGTSYELNTNRVFRDVSAWYHIVVAWDTTQGTAANRIKIYVNGVQETSFSTASYPTQNYDTLVNQNTSHEVGGSLYSTSPRQSFDGYMSEVYFIDGQQLAPTEFGETNDNGVWIPKEYSGTYGNNGFFLEFQNSGALGTDTSGNGNNFTPTNLTATDQTTDTPTNNFATLNPLSSNNATLSEGNVEGIRTSSGSSFTAVSTIAPSNGKWYFEYQNTAAQNSQVAIVNLDVWPSGTDLYNFPVGESAAVLIEANANYNITFGQDASTNTTLQNSTNLITAKYGFAVDIDNNDLYVSANGNWYGGSSFNQSDFSNATAVTTDLPSNAPLAIGVNGSLANTIYINFGNPGGDDSISSGNADANGYGNFEYAVPSGFYSLCTKNLAEYG